MNRDYYKTNLEEIYSKPDWKDRLSKLTNHDKVELIWAAVDLLKEKKLINLAMDVVRVFKDTKDSDEEAELNIQVKKGEDARIITTVRGTLCWLIADIAGQFNTSYYQELIEIIRPYTSDPNLYIRQQSTVPLSLFAVNLRAITGPAGEPFILPAGFRETVKEIIFSMLHDNREWPRVLEYLANTFNGLRDLSGTDVEFVLSNFFYTDDQKLQPDYLVEHATPLAIYYAIFRRTAIEDNFDDAFAKKFLHKLISESSNSDRLRSTLIWHTWKTLSDDRVPYEPFKEYIHELVELQQQYESAGQVEFLILEIIKRDPELGTKYFVKFLDEYSEHFENSETIGRYFLHSFENIVSVVFEKNQKSIPEIFSKLPNLVQKGVYLGDAHQIKRLFLKLPPELQTKSEKYVTEFYKEIKIRNPDFEEVTEND